MKISCAGFVFLIYVLTSSFPTYGAESSKTDRRIPNEYESMGGHSLAFSNSGVAALDGLPAVRMNPGLLPLETQYSIAGTYYWPTSGRDFYQAGIVDSSTASVAAGISATGFSEKFNLEEQKEMDSRAKRRFSLGIGKAFSMFSIGAEGQYVEGYVMEDGSFVLKKSPTVGVGIAGLLTKQLRFGFSAENLSNRKVAELSPRTLRAGVAYLIMEGSVSLNFDLRERERLEFFENPEPGSRADITQDVLIKKYKTPERMALMSFTAKIYDVLRILLSYGQTLTEDKRQTLSGGLALVHQRFSFSYSLSKPYLKYKDTQSALSLNILVSM
ncbi:MAG: hypothetical protein HQK54_01760 [Oligoflexales bacterium]|nr:hypothetical protein [Oligoflexales bacterium]